jgi:hypothetical protein
MKQYFLVSILFFFFGTCIAQQGAGFNFTYDNAGNLIQRKVVVYPNVPPVTGRMASAKDTTQKDSLPPLSVYPNPTFGEVNIDGTLPTNITQADVFLTNEQGQLIKKLIYYGGLTQFNISGVQTGIYYLSVNYSKKNKKVFKIIVTQ